MGNQACCLQLETRDDYERERTPSPTTTHGLRDTPSSCCDNSKGGGVEVRFSVSILPVAAPGAVQSMADCMISATEAASDGSLLGTVKARSPTLRPLETQLPFGTANVNGRFLVVAPIAAATDAEREDLSQSPRSRNQHDPDVLPRDIFHDAPYRSSNVSTDEPRGNEIPPHGFLSCDSNAEPVGIMQRDRRETLPFSCPLSVAASHRRAARDKERSSTDRRESPVVRWIETPAMTAKMLLMMNSPANESLWDPSKAAMRVSHRSQMAMKTRASHGLPL